MRGFSPNELSPSDGADELAVARLDLAAHGHDRGATDLFPALERRVVRVRVGILHGELALCLGVIHYQISIRADLDRPLLRVHAEDARSLRAARGDHVLERQ